MHLFSNEIKGIYFLPKDNIVEEVLIPSFKHSGHVNCMMGYFTSEVLRALAPGLATFLNDQHGQLKLIISPFLKSEDKSAIEEGLEAKEKIINKYFDNFFLTEDEIEKHTLKCLSHLIYYDRLQIKISLMKDALFHPKVWLFYDKENLLAVHGSSNMTLTGIQKNYEQISVAKSWHDDYQNETAKALEKQFNNLWDNKEKICNVVNISKAIKEKLLQSYLSNIPPTENEFLALNSKYKNNVSDSSSEEQYHIADKKSFNIPSWLNYTKPPFEHQGRAVESWCNSGFNGILEMATGSGKTITAMICAYNLYERYKNLLVVISAPYIPLIDQWCEEVKIFGIEPVNISNYKNTDARSKKIHKIQKNLAFGLSDIEVIIGTHNFLCDETNKNILSKYKGNKLLIADEVHNLGREQFINSLPNFFDYKLGLSATPVRQYDEEGTKELFDFFGGIVFQFPLKEAIGNCLVEYDYHVHTVQLNKNEMEEWYELTDKIKKIFAYNDDKDNLKHDESLQKLLVRRRKILETAENKIETLSNVIDEEDLSNFNHVLIYATDKDPKQLEMVNKLLKDKNIMFHQLTSEETKDKDKTKHVIENFQQGHLKVLTAKRVLDEGINIPEIKNAYILASTTIERQWIQRRGRLLRKCESIKKDKSIIHDFITLPPNLNSLDKEAKNIIESELARVEEFAMLSKNVGKKDSSLCIIKELVNLLYK